MKNGIDPLNFNPFETNKFLLLQCTLIAHCVYSTER